MEELSKYFALIIHRPSVPPIGVQVNKVRVFPAHGINIDVSYSEVLYDSSVTYLY